MAKVNNSFNVKNSGSKSSSKMEALIEKTILKEDTSFAIKEAYKSLRSNLEFSILESGCKKIVVTSANQGETKSTTSLNIAIAIAMNSARVLLIECDLRLPQLAKRLKLKKTPGLSNVLFGKAKISESIRHLENGPDVLPAGDIPPNPSEILGSNAMKLLLDKLGDVYDYIILDTPPVCVVTDAAILAKYAAGVVFVVRRGVSRRETVSSALRQLEIAGAKVLGFVYTCAPVVRKKYSHGYKYGYGYGYGYEQAAEEAKSEE